MSHPCAIPDCPQPAKDGQLMCWPHWRRVPKALNYAVFETYREMKGWWNNGAAHVAAREAYRQARDAAIESVVAKEREYDL